MNDNIVTLTKTESHEGIRITYLIHLDYDYIGKLYQPAGSRRWWIADHRENIELWSFKTRAEALEHFTGQTESR